ncbi:hypothetical protein ACN47A_00870 [Myxococcus fulvus]|uniref:hypothetical protein n=1 Tax=Myxococcus fulvus TaxID=33 RepID=UPI003B998063
MKSQVGISKGKGNISVTITFGFASAGEYELKVFDQNDANPDLRTGVSTDDVEDRFDLGRPEDLFGRAISIKAWASTPSSEPDWVGVIVEVEQGQKELAELRLKASVKSHQEAVFPFFIRFVEAK